MDGVEIPGTAPKERGTAMVFQDYALCSHMSVAENIGFAITLRDVDMTERTRMVREAAKLLDLDKYLDREPKALSCGQRQRVAVRARQDSNLQPLDP